MVILNYNVRYFLELCLQSVEQAVKKIDAEIIVVDNNSSDNSCEMIKQSFPEVVLIENKENFGFSKGNNIGVSRAKGKYICILNPDTVVAEDTFSTLLSFADQKKDLGIIGCRLIDGRGQFLPESKRNVPVVKVAFQKMLGNASNYYANNVNEHESGQVDILVGAFMLLKREVFNKVNGFDEDYFMYGDDIDLSFKLLKEGYKNYYVPSTSIIHYKGESTLKDKTYAKRFHHAMQIFYKKHFKKNIFFDALVWLGIAFAYVIRKSPKLTIKPIERYIIISNKNEGYFSNAIQGELLMQSELKDISKDSEVIFDADFLSFKDIIKYMSDFNTNSNVTFKILPKRVKYILGSNDSLNRGEVINL